MECSAASTLTSAYERLPCLRHSEAIFRCTQHFAFGSVLG